MTSEPTTITPRQMERLQHVADMLSLLFDQDDLTAPAISFLILVFPKNDTKKGQVLSNCSHAEARAMLEGLLAFTDKDASDNDKPTE